MRGVGVSPGSPGVGTDTDGGDTTGTGGARERRPTPSGREPPNTERRRGTGAGGRDTEPVRIRGPSDLRSEEESETWGHGRTRTCRLRSDRDKQGVGRRRGKTEGGCGVVAEVRPDRGGVVARGPMGTWQGWGRSRHDRCVHVIAESWTPSRQGSAGRNHLTRLGLRRCSGAPDVVPGSRVRPPSGEPGGHRRDVRSDPSPAPTHWDRTVPVSR